MLRIFYHRNHEKAKVDFVSFLMTIDKSDQTRRNGKTREIMKMCIFPFFFNNKCAFLDQKKRFALRQEGRDYFILMTKALLQDKKGEISLSKDICDAVRISYCRQGAPFRPFSIVTASFTK